MAFSTSELAHEPVGAPCSVPQAECIQDHTFPRNHDGVVLWTVQRRGRHDRSCPSWSNGYVEMEMTLCGHMLYP